MKGVIKRAQTVGAIDSKTAVRLYKQHSARGYNSAEPYPLAPEPPTLVESAIKVHLEDHGYTREELAAATLLTSKEFIAEFIGNSAPIQHKELKPDNVFSLADRRGPTDLSSA